jgi:hypothetical protein
MSSEGYPKYLVNPLQCSVTGTDHNGSPRNDQVTWNDWSDFLDRDLVKSPPNWRELHPLPVNSYYRRQARKKTSLLHETYDALAGFGAGVLNWDVRYPVYLYSLFDPAGDVETSDEALMNKLNNLLMDRAQAQKINIAQFIAERRQVVNMVSSTATRLARGIRAIRRGDFRGALDSLGYSGRVKAHRSRRGSLGGVSRSTATVASDWSAIQYGWKPLLGDLHGGLETFANACETYRPPVLRVSAKASVATPKVVHYPSQPYPRITWTSEPGVLSGKAFVEFRLSSEFGTLLGSTGLANPYEVAWELVPYSFVVDWFIPIGDYLRRLTYDTGLVFSRGAYSLKSERQWTCSVEEDEVQFMEGSTYTRRRIRASKRAVESHAFGFRRQKMESMPLPILPSFRDPFSPTRATNALALMATSFGRDPRVFRPR